ncbi:MAG: porin, partial [Verrucomicrobiae bacterium]|nr:porin [Verrucomicrobiae bacterium]
DNNSGKTLLGRVGLTFWDGKLKNALTAMGGPEQNSNNSRYRWIVDDVLTWQPPMENLLLQLNAMYGSEDGALDSAGFYHRGNFAWWGASASARYQWTPFVSMGLRYEYFSDSDGARTDGAQGLRTLIGPQPWPGAAFSNLNGVDYQAVTWAIWLEKLFPNFTPRVEVRWDRANEPAFRAQDKNGIFRSGENSQVTVSFDATYVF